MFAKNEYEKAASMLQRAEEELNKQQLFSDKFDEAHAKACADLLAVDARERQTTASDGPFERVDADLRADAAERLRLGTQIDQYARLREAAAERLVAAKVAIFDAETQVQAALRAQYEKAALDALEKVWSSIREPLRQAVAVLGGAHYFEGLLRNESFALQAWNSTTADSLLDGRLGEFICAKVASDKAAFYAGIQIDGPPRGLPPIRAGYSSRIGQDDRQIASSLRARQVPITLQTFAREIAQRHSTTGAPDTRYSPAEKIREWTAEIVRIEELIASERVREYPAFSDGAPIDSAALRKRNVAQLEKRLQAARDSLAQWQSNLSSAA